MQFVSSVFSLQSTVLAVPAQISALPSSRENQTCIVYVVVGTEGSRAQLVLDSM